MKRKTKITTLSDGCAVFAYLPGWVEANGDYYLYTANGVQLQVVKGLNSTATGAVVTVEALGTMLEVAVEFDYTVYNDIDLTAYCRQLTRRLMSPPEGIDVNTITAIITVSFVEGDSTIDDVIFNVQIADAVLFTQLPVCLPDVIRLPSSGYEDFAQITLAGVEDGESQLRAALCDANGDEIAALNVPSAGEPVQAGISDRVAFFQFGEAFIRVERENCMADKVLVLWYSPRSGGYKSFVANVKSLGLNGERQEVNVGFEAANTASFSEVLQLEFPRLNPPTFNYLVDVVFSDEIYIVTPQQLAAGEVARYERDRVTVVGNDAAQVGLLSYKDFNITVKKLNINTL